MSSVRVCVFNRTRAIVCAAVLGVASHATADPISVVELTVQDVQQGLAAGDFTVLELTEAHFDRIDTFEPFYNAFISFNPTARTEAAALDAEYAVSGPRSPLHGVPVVLKEANDLAGVPSTAGFAGFSSAAGGVDLIPENDGAVVKRLRDAGAVIIGKTNVPPFSLAFNANESWDGPTFNAYNRELIPGGSSSGSSTAVAASFAVLATGSETAGSIQAPAAAQSLVGIKPTFGLVPNTGATPIYASTRDTTGPLARTVYDAAIALDIMAGFTPADPKTLVAIGNIPEGGYTAGLSETALQGARLGLYGPGFDTVPLDAPTQALYQAAIEAIQGEGAVTVADPFAGTDFNTLTPPGQAGNLVGSESIVFDFQQYLKNLGPSAAANTLDALKDVTGVDLFAFPPDGPIGFLATSPEAQASLADPDSPPDLSNFIAAREELLDAFNEVLEDNDLDGLVFPFAANSLPGLFSDDPINAITVAEINIMGVPAVTVPAGYYDNGSPFSLLCIGEMFSEPDLLAYAYDFEQATMARRAPNLVPSPTAVGGGLVLVLGLAARRRRRTS